MTFTLNLQEIKRDKTIDPRDLRTEIRLFGNKMYMGSHFFSIGKFLLP